MDAHLIALPLQAGSAVRLERMSRKWTQKQLAEKAGVSERLVNALEAGDAKGIRLDKLMAIYGALDMRLVGEEAGGFRRGAGLAVEDIQRAVERRGNGGQRPLQRLALASVEIDELETLVQLLGLGILRRHRANPLQLGWRLTQVPNQDPSLRSVAIFCRGR